MLRRIKEIFKRDQEEENKSPKKSINRRFPQGNIETKMKYKYPRHTPFRFPVIPDEVGQKRKRQYKRPNNNQLDQMREHEKIQNEKGFRKKPFTPSEVASPIYGYMDRKIEAEVQNLPAFIRKQKNEVAEKTAQKESVEQLQNVVYHNGLNERYEGKSSLHAYESTEDKEEAAERVNHDVSYVPIEAQEEKTARVLSKEKVPNVPKIQATEPIVPIDHKEQLEKTVEDVQLMPFHLLNDPVRENSEDRQWVREQQNLLEQTLTHFNVQAKVVNATQGPSVTRFEVQPELGVKVSRVRNLSDDIKMNMAARDIRIEAPIPGKNTIGIEVPNLNGQTVGLQEIIDTETFRENNSPLTIGLGLSIEGKPHITTIDKMPHGLIAGATGSGKSVCINTILISLLYKSSHEDVKLLLIDPKMVELAPYNGIPHLVSPVITDVKAATAALKWAVVEMEERYEQFVRAGVRDIHRFNKQAVEQGHDKMPHFVIIIDELADLMMASPQDVEDAICRIAQKARACGMHLILATQRPSVDVITGLIKANIPTRIAFSVSSQVDSRTIIDTNGAERLLGKGDMLFIENGSGKSVRLQGAFVSDDEIERVTNFAKSFGEPNYLFQQEQLIQQVEADVEEDELFEDVIQFILEHDQASTSLLQRHFRIGYNRAARLIDTLESRGMISEQNGSKPREVLFTIDQLEQFI